MGYQDLKDRTKRFALRVVQLVRAMPNSLEAREIGRQLLRAGTSVGANYRAACRARSKAEFLSKLGIVEEEADESAFWLEIIIDAGLLEKNQVEPLLNEADELTAIMVSSRKSTRKRINQQTLGTRNSKHPKENSKLEIRNSKLETRNSKLEKNVHH